MHVLTNFWEDEQHSNLAFFAQHWVGKMLSYTQARKACQLWTHGLHLLSKHSMFLVWPTEVISSFPCEKKTQWLSSWTINDNTNTIRWPDYTIHNSTQRILGHPAHETYPSSYTCGLWLQQYHITLFFEISKFKTKTETWNAAISLCTCACTGCLQWNHNQSINQYFNCD